MAQPVFYTTLNQLGMDPTMYVVASPSVTPEYPAPPFLVGTKGIGSDGSEFVYVQASTSISLTDFVVINTGSTGGGSYQANSVTTTNVGSSIAVGLASTGLVLRQSVTYIPAQAYFWACTKGQYLPATTSGGTGGLATNVNGVLLFTSATAGVLTSVTTSQSLLANIVGIVCINSLTISIASSIVPPVGTLTSTGYAQGPIVNMNSPRTVITWSSSVGNLSLPVFTF